MPRSHPAALALLLLAACADESPLLVADPLALDLGTVPVGGAAEARFAVRNAGDRTVALHAITLAEGDLAAWTLDGQLTDLFPGARANFTMRFTPVAPGWAHARVELHSDDPAQPTLGVTLTGTGEVGGNQWPDDGPGPGAGNPDAGGDTGGDSGGGDPGTDPGSGEACGDADGDGHDLCDPGGDCDDTDPSAYPVLVSASAAEGDGTAAAPYPTIAEAIEHLDARCHEVVLLAGTHAAAVTWEEGELTVRGVGAAHTVTVTPPAGRAAFTVEEEARLHLASLTLAGARPGHEDEEEDGGALRVEGGDVTLDRVRLSDNESAEDGGAVALEGGSLTLAGCTLDANRADGDGGAVYAWAGTVRDTGSAWTGNSARNGGALAVHHGTLELTDGHLQANTAHSAGGAVYARDVTSIRVERAVLLDGQAGWRGGGIAVDGADAGLLRNLVIQGGGAGNEGGAVAVGGCAELVLANNTLVDTAAADAGAALWLGGEPGCTAWAWSTVVAGTSGSSAVDVADGASASVAYTLSDEALDLSAADGGHNLVGDPRFTAFTDDGVANDHLTLAPGSPAVDTGPADGAGPASYTQWTDPDGSRNDRGATGGPGAP